MPTDADRIAELEATVRELVEALEMLANDAEKKVKLPSEYLAESVAAARSALARATKGEK